MGNYQDECHLKEIHQLAEEFESCRKLLLALGDQNRQHLILEMMRMGQCEGVRVGAITEKTNLPALLSRITSGSSKKPEM